jgi:hypothetical protein
MKTVGGAIEAYVGGDFAICRKRIQRIFIRALVDEFASV